MNELDSSLQDFYLTQLLHILKPQVYNDWVLCNMALYLIKLWH